MRVIEPKVTLIKEDNPFKKIELVGRTCYKSTSDLTEETASTFYKGLVSRQHFAMLEHAVFVFEVRYQDPNHIKDVFGYKYLNYTYEQDNMGHIRFLVSGNLRALNESGCLPLLKTLHTHDPRLVYREVVLSVIEDMPVEEDITIIRLEDIDMVSEREFDTHAHFSLHFMCDRGVSHEMVRHRPASFAQESTRYCNYSKDKFNNEVTFIKPSNFDNWSYLAQDEFLLSLQDSERHYFNLLGRDCTPQEARAVLPNALKTEVIMTANAQEWKHFFNLRSKGTTGAPHPDMKKVADQAYEIFSEERTTLLY